MKKVKGILFAVATAVILCLVAFVGCKGFNKVKSTVNYKNSDKYSIGNFTYSAAEVETVKINWIAGEICVLHGTSDTLSVAEEGGANLADEQKLHYLLEDKTLNIQFCKSGYKSEINSNSKKLSVQVPKGIELEINNVSSNIDINELDIKGIKIDSVSGNINAKLTRADVMDIDNVSGKVTIKTAASTAVDIDTVSGDIELDIGGQGAIIDYDTVSGKYTAPDNKIVYGDASMIINVDSVSGSLTIKK